MSAFFHHSCLEFSEPFQTPSFFKPRKLFFLVFKLLPPLHLLLFSFWVYYSHRMGLSPLRLLISARVLPSAFCFGFCIISSSWFSSSPSSPLKPLFLVEESVFFCIWLFKSALVLFSFLFPVAVKVAVCLLPQFWVNVRLFLLAVGFPQLPIIFTLSFSPPECRYKCY